MQYPCEILNQTCLCLSQNLPLGSCVGPPRKPLPPENRVIWSNVFGDRYMGLSCRHCHKLKPHTEWGLVRRWWSRNELCLCLPMPVPGPR